MDKNDYHLHKNEFIDFRELASLPRREIILGSIS